MSLKKTLHFWTIFTINFITDENTKFHGFNFSEIYLIKWYNYMLHLTGIWFQANKFHMYISILQKSVCLLWRTRLYNSKKAIEFSLQLLPKFFLSMIQGTIFDYSQSQIHSKDNLNEIDFQLCFHFSNFFISSLCIFLSSWFYTVSREISYDTETFHQMSMMCQLYLYNNKLYCFLQKVL